MTEVLQSLSAFCKAHGIPKSSASRKLRSEGFDTTDGLNSEAVSKLRAMYGLDQAKQYTQLAVQRTSEITFSTGDFDELAQFISGEFEHVEGEIVEDGEDNQDLIARMAEQQNKLEEMEEYARVLRGRSKADRHFQIEQEEYNSRLVELQTAQVLSTAKGTKARQANRAKKGGKLAKRG